MDVFPLPLIEEGMDTLGGNIWDFKLDANFLYFAFLIQSLKIGEYPEEWTLFSSSLETKFYWVNREAFLMNSEGGSVREKQNMHPRRLVVLTSCRTAILQLSHDNPGAGSQRPSAQSLVKLEGFRRC